MKGVLLHGGFGTRLRPLTHTGPKQLIKIAGKPVSQWALEDLRDSGIRNVAIILGELAPERVVEYYGDGSRLGMNLTYIYQGYPYGLAHAVYIAKEYVGDEPFVVYLGDNVLIEGIGNYAKKFLEESDAAAMILLTRVPDPQRFGVAEFDEKGRLRRLIEKPKHPPSNYALVGIYFFRPPHIFKVIEELRPSWRGELEITDAIQKLLDQGLRVEYAIVRGWWKDTGTPEDILEANRLLLDYKYKEKTIEGEIDKKTRIEGRIHIGRNTKIVDSVIRGPAYIGENNIIGPGVYIGPYTSIGDNCRISNVELENSVLMDNVVLENLEQRIVDSLIGSNTIIQKKEKKPKGYRLIVGENTVVEL